MYAPLLAASLRNYITTDLTLRHVTLRYDESLVFFLLLNSNCWPSRVVKQSLARISRVHCIRQIPSILIDSIFIDTRWRAIGFSFFFKFTTRTRKRLKLINICFVFFVGVSLFVDIFRDYLFRLSLDGLTLLEESSWPAAAEVVSLCQDKGQSEEDCHNYIRVLHVQGNVT